MYGLLSCLQRASNQAEAAAAGLYLERHCFCHFPALHCCIEAASRQLYGSHIGLHTAGGVWLTSRVFDLFKQVYSTLATEDVSGTDENTHNSGFEGHHLA
jgi:hypothetical protein